MQSHRPAAYIVGGSLNWLCNFTVGFIFPFLQVPVWRGCGRRRGWTWLCCSPRMGCQAHAPGSAQCWLETVQGRVTGRDAASCHAQLGGAWLSSPSLLSHCPQMSAGAFCYLVFCGVCLLVALYVYLVIPETKNKTFMEISHIFATRRSFLSIPAHLIGMKKLNGYGALESSSLEGLDSSLP